MIPGVSTNLFYLIMLFMAEKMSNGCVTDGRSSLLLSSLHRFLYLNLSFVPPATFGLIIPIFGKLILVVKGKRKANSKPAQPSPPH